MGEGHRAEALVLLGNEAIGRGLVEAGCQVVTSYPGTPSSEILPAVVRFKQREELPIVTHWAINEKVAFDEALAAAYTGKRAAVIMKQVGLNVAADSLMSAAYTGVKGGFVVISADDPGPHSSQTEQDSRFFALFAKIPCFDPADAQEAKDMLQAAFELSERHEIPVMLRPSIRVCHARMDVTLERPRYEGRRASFKKDPHRWAATPAYRYQLHRQLNRKLDRIRAELESSELLNPLSPSADPGRPAPVGVIAAGVSHTVVRDLLAEHDLDDRVDVLKIGTPHPLPRARVEAFIAAHDRVLLLEDPGPTIELQIDDRRKVRGRLDGSVPGEGELTPEVLLRVLGEQLGEGLAAAAERAQSWLGKIDGLVEQLELPRRPPTLCAGCGHRAAFYAIKKALPRAIFTSDIGCYTLGINLKAVDTVLDMGAGLTLATGFCHAYRQDGEVPPVVATMGDSTFFHSGIPALVGAVTGDARFIFVLLDNAITAMTGMQPTPALGVDCDGTAGNKVDIPTLIRGCGVRFLRTVDPYDVDEMIALIKEAHDFTQQPDGGVAVIHSKRPCLIAYRDGPRPSSRVELDEARCDGCQLCTKRFGCPALSFDGERELARLDRARCVDCGVCAAVCPQEALRLVDASQPAEGGR